MESKYISKSILLSNLSELKTFDQQYFTFYQ